MKVILISKVVNAGNIGDVVDVKDGYARNFLIPQNKAIHYTKANYKFFEDSKQKFEEENKKSLVTANDVKKKISGKDIIIIENASDDGRLYGSVNTVTISNKINDIVGKKSVSRSNVILEKPIKDIGVYRANIDLHSDSNFNVRVIVTRSESEVKSLLEKDKENSQKASKENVDTDVVVNSDKKDSTTKKDVSNKKEVSSESHKNSDLENKKQEATS